MPPAPSLPRLSSLLYLSLIVAAAFALSVRSSIAHPGDAAATADAIRASSALFRLSFVVDLGANLLFLLTAMALFLLLRHVNQLAAAAMVTIVAVSVAVGSLNLLNQLMALTIATNDVYLRAFGAGGADALTLLYTESATSGNTLNAIWYGPWLVPLAYLVINSGFFPRGLGYLQLTACVAYLGWLLVTFLAPAAPGFVGSGLLTVAGLGEGAFVVWFAVKGLRRPASASLGSMSVQGHAF